MAARARIDSAADPFAKTEGEGAIVQEPNSPVNTDLQKPTEQGGNSPRKQNATFSFDPATLDALQRAWLELNSGRGRTVKVSKSAIVEAGLLAILGDAELLAGLGKQ